MTGKQRPAADARIRIGAITIGQSPRTDITDDIRPLLAPNIQLQEYGALDPYSYEEAAQKFAPAPGDPVLVSRMRDGSQVTMAEHAVVPLVQECIYRAELDGVQAVVLLCTGKFPELDHSKPLIVPQPILHGLIQKLTGKKPIALFVPDQAQVSQVNRWFTKSQIDIFPVVASPYREAHLMGEKAAGLSDKDFSFALLDCMGYSKQMKQDIHSACGLPVLLPRTFIARLLNELYGAEEL